MHVTHICSSSLFLASSEEVRYAWLKLLQLIQRETNEHNVFGVLSPSLKDAGES